MNDLPVWAQTLLAVGGCYLAFSLICLAAIVPLLINAPLIEEDTHEQ